MSKFDERLDKVLDRVTSNELLSGRGLGNEIGFYIFDYPPERELAVRDHTVPTCTGAEAESGNSRKAHQSF